MANKRRPQDQSDELLADANPMALSVEVCSDDSHLSATSDAAVGDILDHCCVEIEKHHEEYLRAALYGLQHALRAGKYANILKEAVGHGNFQSFCEERIPGISFRRIQQYKKLADSEGDLVLLLRAENAQHGAPLGDDALLGSASIRKAQRLLSGNTEESFGKGRRKKRKSTPVSEHSGAFDELLTPPAIVAAAAEFFGTIDLDPCAAEENPHYVAAVRCLTQEENGLADAVSWKGKAFIHPPVSGTQDWVAKAVREYRAGALAEAILLLPAETDAVWFSQLKQFPRAFLRDRPQFHDATSDSAIESEKPYLLVVIAPDDRLPAFAECFFKLADIFVPHAFAQ